MTNLFLLKQFLPKTASNFCEILSPVRKKQERTEKELSGSALGQQNTNATANVFFLIVFLPLKCKMNEAS
jgi:hypothetical protein